MSKPNEGDKPKENIPKEGQAGGATSSPSRTKGHSPLPGGCHAWGCKTPATRFNFCDEHYDHFKFGLVRKTGEPVPDHEKKLGQFLAYKAREKAQKAA